MALCLMPAARAGTFRVEACADAPSGANHSWTQFNNDVRYLQTENNCGGSGVPAAGGPWPYTSGLSASDVLGLVTPVPPNAAAGWTFAAPAGTTISAAILDRDLYKRNDNAWLSFVSDQVGNQVPGQNCTIDPAVAYQCEVSGTLSLGGLNVTSLSIGAICVSGCATGLYAHNVRADLDHAIVTITDPAPPSAPIATGPLAGASWHAGVVTLNLSSTDTVGISRLEVKADGTTAASVVQQCDYTYTVPCPQARAVPLQIDTTRAPDGVARLTLVAVDAAQNQASSTIDVMVANHRPAPPSLSGAPPGWTAQPTATITARLPAAGVPIDRVEWMLCASACTAASAVRVPPGAASVSFGVTAPGDGAYTVAANAVDAAGHFSSTATEPFYVDRSAPPPPSSSGGPIRGAAPAAVRLGTGSHASVKLPVTVGRSGLKLHSRLRRRAHRRLELDLQTRPARAGRVRVGFAFSGHRAQSHTVRLRRGAAVFAVRIPGGATKLTIAVVGLGVNATTDVLLTGA